MKISEMTNAQATAAIIRLADPVGNICDDEEIINMLNDFNNAGETPIVQTIGKLLPRLVAYAFQKHIDDLYEIVGALTQKTKSEVERMNFAETIKVFKESYDDVLAGFFTGSKASAKKKGTT